MAKISKSTFLARSLTWPLALLLLLIFQPFFITYLQVTPVYAQSTSDVDPTPSPEDFAGDVYKVQADSLNDLDWILSDEERVTMAPQDVTALAKCGDISNLKDCNIDVRTINYLTYLVAPVEAGGAGLGHIRVSRLVRSYETNGIGKYDRESVDATTEDQSVYSTHYDGKAIDISEVGEITCKLVYRRHGLFGIGGGSTTKWQAPKPIKVAWQSRDGIAKSPTPNGASLIGTAQGMTAANILQYLNESGQMDAYVDYVKGLDFQTVASYVGANIFLKNYGAGQISQDPLANNLIAVLGEEMLKRSLPSLPDGLSSANGTEDISIGIGKARLEANLNLPAGSLRDLGWDGVLTETGKRVIEQSLGLPSLFLEDHDLKDLNAVEAAQTALNYLKRSDDSFGVIAGTIDKLKNNDVQGLRMAAVSMLANAFKLTDEQRTKLADAVTNNQKPDLDPAAFPVNNAISSQGLAALFSLDKNQQQQATDELKQAGLTLLEQAASKAVPTAYAGVTKKLLNDLINHRQSGSLDDIAMKVGSSQITAESGGTEVIVSSGQKISGTIAQAVAVTLNQDLQLTGDNQLQVSDIQAMFTHRGGNDAIKKLAGGEIDRAVGWNTGTALQVINKQKKFEDAMKEVFANAVASMFGLNPGDFTLDGNMAKTFATAIIEQRLGLPKGTITDKSTPESIAQTIGNQKYQEIFGAPPGATTVLDTPNVTTKLNNLDLNLGLPAGTLKQMLKKEVGVDVVTKMIIDGNINQLTPDKIWQYFDLEDTFRIDAKEAQNIIDVIKAGDDADLKKREEAIQSIYKIVGRSVDSKTNFSLDAFMSYFTAVDDKEKTKILLDQGLQLFTKAIGVNVDGLDSDKLKTYANELKDIFNNGTAGFEDARKEFATLDKLGKARTAVQEARYVALRNNPAVGAYVFMTDFLLKATGVPIEFTDDARTFLEGDYQKGLESMSFVLWQKNINPYLPADAQLSYAELRNTIIFDDPSQIDARAHQDFIDPNDFDKLPSGTQAELRGAARRQIMDETRKNVEYKISDSFLRKADSTIPVGFTRVMFSGTDQERAALLQGWAINHVDTLLQQADPNYVAGTLEAVYNGTADDQKAALIQNIVSHINISLGPLGGEQLIDFVSFLTSKDRAGFYTDTKYGAMWSSVNSWVSSTLGIGDLPTGTAQSLFYASQHNWDFNAEFKDAQGAVLVASLNSMGQDFVLGKVSSWGDKQFKLPAGTMLRTYQAVKAVADASRILAQAHEGKAAIDAATASNNLSKAQASLTVLVITTALEYCAACQEFFSSVDRAIAAPPGFTNAAVAGAIAMAFGLGPAGLYVAAAIYLFGVYRVDYLCPEPPQDPYAITTFDKDYDQFSGGYVYNSTTSPPVQANPAPGQNPFDWDDNVSFVDGAKSEVWMGWARYYTGLLLDRTLSFGESVPDINKPRQIITLRQANAEFFASRAESAFGAGEKNNPRVGMGFSQDTTKTTDWVHVGFGGYF